MPTDQLVNLIISIAPSIIAILTTVGVIIKTLKEFAELKKQVTDMKAIDDIRDQLREVLKENSDLKKKLNETMTKIDHIERK